MDRSWLWPPLLLAAIAGFGLAYAGAPPATAASPELIKGVAGTGTDSSSPSDAVRIDGRVYFVATDRLHGGELWASDGTRDGTTLVRDINPGTAGSRPFQLTKVGDTLYFGAGDGAHGDELWQSDGTSGGTVMVADIQAGPESSLQRYNEFTPIAKEGLLYFAADDGVHGQELWRSDGTEAGTAMVLDIWPGPGSSTKFGSDTVVLGDAVYLTAEDGTHGAELWRSDGTAAGTDLVADIYPGASDAGPAKQTVVGDTLFFSADSPGVNRELWKSDGTVAGTSLVKDIRLGIAPSQIDELTTMGGTLYFVADQGAYGDDWLWRSDGTGAGTTPVRSAATADVVAVGDALYFRGDDAEHGRELWKSDGTPAGTALVSDIRPGPLSSNPIPAAGFDGTLFLTADDGPHGREPWISDGTDGGTALLDDVNTRGNASSGSTAVAVVGDELLLASDDGVVGRELWRTNGSAGSVQLVKDIASSGSLSPTNLSEFGGGLAFSGSDGIGGREPWLSDGTTSGTTPIKDIYPGAHGSSPSQFVDVAGTALFAADDGSHGRELWRSDGTAQGTALVKDIATGGRGSNPSSLVSVGDTLYFTADDGDHGVELWRSDGTTAGTALVADLTAGTGSSRLWAPTDFDGVLIFATASGVWRSDGTAAGTTLIRSLAGVDSGSPTGFTIFDGSLYLSGRASGESYSSLWKTDGTVEGTSQVKTGIAARIRTIGVDGTLYFTAGAPGATILDLWRSDGTAGGASLVKRIGDVDVEDFGAHFAVLSRLGTTLLVAHSSTWDTLFGSGATTLWRSDGTAAGTLAIADLGFYPGPAVQLGEILYLSATDAQHGRELWATDATAEGTGVLEEIAPGPASSSPEALTVIDETLFFAATDAAGDTGLWALPADSSPDPTPDPRIPDVPPSSDRQPTSAAPHTASPEPRPSHPTSPGGRKASRLHLARQAILRGREMILRVRCDDSQPCAGTLRVLHALCARCRPRATLAKGRFAVAAHSSKRVSIRLTAKGRTLARRRPADGNKFVASALLTDAIADVRSRILLRARAVANQGRSRPAPAARCAERARAAGCRAGA